MLPTSWGYLPPARYDTGSIFRRGLIFRGLTAGLLWWITWQFPRLTWHDAWVCAASLALLDGLAGMALKLWPQRLRTMIRASLIGDSLVGWGTAWAFSQSPDTMVPALIILFLQEILAYYPTRRGVVWAGGYIIVTNVLLGLLPGIYRVPMWPWPVVIYWTVADILVLGVLLVPMHFPLPARDLRNLTAREREIYYLMAAGWSTTAIAEHLHIDASTVRSHVAHLHHKLRQNRL